MFRLLDPCFSFDQGVIFLFLPVETFLFDSSERGSDVPGVSPNRLGFWIDVGLLDNGLVLDGKVVAEVGNADCFCEKSSGVENPFLDLPE